MVRKFIFLILRMKFINRYWAINNAMPVLLIGFFAVIINDTDIASFIGFCLMFFSFYLWYFDSKQEKKIK